MCLRMTLRWLFVRVGAMTPRACCVGGLLGVPLLDLRVKYSWPPEFMTDHRRKQSCVSVDSDSVHLVPAFIILLPFPFPFLIKHASSQGEACHDATLPTRPAPPASVQGCRHRRLRGPTPVPAAEEFTRSWKEVVCYLFGADDVDFDHTYPRCTALPTLAERSI